MHAEAQHVECRWDRLDDVIMGGKSESSLKAGSDGNVVWSGTLRVEGGGFCGVRSKASSFCSFLHLGL